MKLKTLTPKQIEILLYIKNHDNTNIKQISEDLNSPYQYISKFVRMFENFKLITEYMESRKNHKLLTITPIGNKILSLYIQINDILVLNNYIVDFAKHLNKDEFAEIE